MHFSTITGLAIQIQMSRKYVLTSLQFILLHTDRGIVCQLGQETLPLKYTTVHCAGFKIM